jgi:hypothetical protein
VGLAVAVGTFHPNDRSHVDRTAKENAMKSLIGSVAAVALSLTASAALAESYGSVKVECWGRCDLVNLGQICDSFVASSQPIAVSCDDTDVGLGSNITCGSATCRPYGAVVRSDLLSAYCADGGGYDAVVTCRTATLSLDQARSLKQDDAQR